MRSQWINTWHPGGYRNLLLPHAWTGSDLPPASNRVDDAARRIFCHQEQEEWTRSAEPIAAHLPLAAHKPQAPVPKATRTATTRSFPLWPAVLMLVGLWLYLCWSAGITRPTPESNGSTWVEPLKRSAELASEESRSAWKELQR